MSEDTGRLKLHEAAAEGRRLECEELVASCEDVNTIDQLGWTPLMHAVRNGHCHLAKYLISHGADVCLHNHHGVTVLTLAVLRCDEELLQTLYDCLPLELRQCESDNALQVACVRGCYSAARWLLATTPAQVNLVSTVTGVTPLQLSVIGKHHKVVELLLRFGADTTMVSMLGQDVFELALISGDRKLFNLLQNNTSPTKLACFDYKVMKPDYEPLDKLYTSNNLYLDLPGDIVLKNSPGRPVFKTCDDNNKFNPKYEREMRSMLSPSLKSVFLPSPETSNTPMSQSWDNCSLKREYDLSAFASPTHEYQHSSNKTPTKTPSRGKKRKFPHTTGCSSWLNRFTKRRSRSLEDDTDGCLESNSSKKSSIDFSQLLFGLELDEFFPIFKEHELDIWMFLTLTAEDLEAIGINNPTSQMRILKTVEMLRKTQLLSI